MDDPAGTSDRNSQGESKGDSGGLVLLGEIVGVHGVRGLVKVRTFTEEPENLTAYGPLVDQQGRPVRLTLKGRAKGTLLAAVDGVADRTQAERLRGRELYVERAALPAAEADEDEYYHADLIGLAVDLEDGSRFGRIAAVQAFGAGDMLEVEADADRRRVFIPFTREMVPLVDVKAGRVVVAPMPGLLD